MKLPLAIKMRGFVPLFRSVSESLAARPLRVPPIVTMGLAIQLTVTFVTSAPFTMPLPLLTVHVCPTGWVTMVTL